MEAPTSWYWVQQIISNVNVFHNVDCNPLGKMLISLGSKIQSMINFLRYHNLYFFGWIKFFKLLSIIVHDVR